ncbi:MAG TPA: FAD-dependent oxidoreductase [Gaiellaceae bacterium]|nr:FAD-dependent oxidoreductase [Gaiellaceae bacterium]
MRVAIVGGGVVGMSCAFGLLDVADELVVLDAGSVGGGASAGNTGWVSPSVSTPLAAPGVLTLGLRSALDPRGALVIRPSLDPAWIAWLLRFARSSRQAAYRRGVAALLELTSRTLAELDRMSAAGVEFEEYRAGILVVARDQAGLHWFEKVFDELVPLGFPGDLDEMSGDEARKLEPALGPAVGRATRTSIDRHVRPETLVAGLAAHVRAQGCTVRENVAVRSVRRVGETWALDGEDGELERADVVVLASALGTVDLLRPLGLRVPLVGAKGYSVTLPLAEGLPAMPLYLCEPKIGTSPYAGELRLAGFFELGARDGAASPVRSRQLVEETQPYLSRQIAPGGAIPAGWAGFRPATPDSLPLLGPVPGAPGVLVATGHGMLGVTLAPATGVAVAALVRGERPSWLAPLDPARFRSVVHFWR